MNAAIPLTAARVVPPPQVSVAPVGFAARARATGRVAPGPVPATRPSVSRMATVGCPRRGAPAVPDAGGAAKAAAAGTVAGIGPRARRPLPKVLFGTGEPSGTARCFRSAASAVGVSDGSASRSSAAAPVTKGADWLVPQNSASIVVGRAVGRDQVGLEAPVERGPLRAVGLDDGGGVVVDGAHADHAGVARVGRGWERAGLDEVLERGAGCPHEQLQQRGRGPGVVPHRDVVSASRLRRELEDLERIAGASLGVLRGLDQGVAVVHEEVVVGGRAGPPKGHADGLAGAELDLVRLVLSLELDPAVGIRVLWLARPRGVSRIAGRSDEHGSSGHRGIQQRVVRVGVGAGAVAHAVHQDG